MTAATLVSKLRRRGVALSSDGNTLVIRPASAVTPDERNALRVHKAEIVAILRAGETPAPAEPSLPLIGHAAEVVAVVTALVPEAEVVAVRPRQPADAWGPLGAVPPAAEQPDAGLLALATLRLTPTAYAVAPTAVRNIHLGPEPERIQPLARRFMAAERHLQTALATQADAGLRRREAVRLLGAQERPKDERLDQDLALALIYARAGRTWHDDGGTLWPIRTP